MTAAITVSSSDSSSITQRHPSPFYPQDLKGLESARWNLRVSDPHSYPCQEVSPAITHRGSHECGSCLLKVSLENR